MEYPGAFLGAQLDLTTAAGEEYITFNVSDVHNSSINVNRVTSATRACPGTHTAEDTRPWIEALSFVVLTYSGGYCVELFGFCLAVLHFKS